MCPAHGTELSGVQALGETPAKAPGTRQCCRSHVPQPRSPATPMPCSRVSGSKASSAASQQPSQQPGASPGTGLYDTACLGELSKIPEQKCSCPVKMLGNAHSPSGALLLSASTEGSLCLLSTKSVFYQNGFFGSTGRHLSTRSWATESGYGKLWKSFHLQKSGGICGCIVAEDCPFVVCSL